WRTRWGTSNAGIAGSRRRVRFVPPSTEVAGSSKSTGRGVFFDRRAGNETYRNPLIKGFRYVSLPARRSKNTPLPVLLEEPATSVLGGTKRTRRRDPAMPAFEVPQRVRH